MLPRARFAVATATAKTLSRGVVAAVADLKRQLGPTTPPHFCQLLISLPSDDRGVQLGPTFLEEILRTKGAPAPVTIGAAVQVLLERLCHAGWPQVHAYSGCARRGLLEPRLSQTPAVSPLLLHTCQVQTRSGSVRCCRCSTSC